MLDDLSAKLEVSGNDLMTQEDLLSGSKADQVEFENSYLLTELDSQRPESPSGGALNTSTGRRRKALKSDALKQNEKLIREEESDQVTDFIEYLESLVDFYRQLDHLDSAGNKLMNVFKQKKNFQVLSMRNWILNLDVWGSYIPLNAQCYDI